MRRIFWSKHPKNCHVCLCFVLLIYLLIHIKKICVLWGPLEDLGPDGDDSWELSSMSELKEDWFSSVLSFFLMESVMEVSRKVVSIRFFGRDDIPTE